MSSPACPSCARAAAHPRTGLYHAGCQTCAARALAQSPMAHQAFALGKGGALRKAVLAAFGDAGFEAGRALVLQWVERFKESGHA